MELILHKAYRMLVVPIESNDLKSHKRKQYFKIGVKNLLLPVPCERRWLSASSRAPNGGIPQTVLLEQLWN